ANCRHIPGSTVRAIPGSHAVLPVAALHRSVEGQPAPLVSTPVRGSVGANHLWHYPRPIAMAGWRAGVGRRVCTGSRPSSPGRHDFMMLSSTRTAIGIDLGGTNLKGGVVDDTGTILFKRSRPAPSKESSAEDI